MDGLQIINFILIFTSTVTAFASGLVWNPQNFPRNDCRMGDFDIVVIAQRDYMQFKNINQTNAQYIFMLQVLQTFLSPGETDLGRVRIALLEPSAHNCERPVSTVAFRDSNTTSQLLEKISEQWNNNVLRASKPWAGSCVNNAHQIFAHDGRKGNVTHITILIASAYLIGYVFLEELKGTILKESSSSDMMLFTFVYGDLTTRVVLDPQSLPDTLVRFWNPSYPFDQRLSLTLCKSCSEGWIFHEQREGIDELSCHKTVITDDWSHTYQGTFDYCGSLDATLSSLESPIEMQAIHNALNISIGERLRKLTFFIALERDILNLPHTFHWENGRPLMYKLSDLLRSEELSRCNIIEYRFLPVLKSVLKPVGCFEVHSDIGVLCEQSITSKMEMMVVPSPTESAISRLLDDNTKTFFKHDGDIISSLSSLNLKEVSEFNNFKHFICDPNYKDHSDVIPYILVCDHKIDCRYSENAPDEDENLCVKRWCDYHGEFTCNSGQCIASNKKCDLISDCFDGSDEENCQYCSNKVAHCPYDTNKCLPLHWFLDGKYDCNGDEDSSHLSRFGSSPGCPFICDPYGCVSPSHFNDGIVHCLGPEGPLDERFGALNWQPMCLIESRDNVTLYRMAPRCYYIEDRYGAVLGCRDMSHLHDCQDVVCQEGYVKCPNSYCIPIHFIRNGKMDCAYGEDEVNEKLNCSGNFRCHRQNLCLHPDLVCDGIIHCLYGDDEMECGVTCAAGFSCLGGALTVLDYDTSLPLANLSFLDHRTRYINLSGVDLSFSFTSEFDRGRFENVIELYLSNCKLRNALGSFVRDKSTLDSVYHMDASYNLFEEIRPDSMFAYMTNMHILNLSHNKRLKTFQVRGLYESRGTKVENLDLSYTGIEYFNEKMIKGFEMLKELNLSHTLIRRIHENMFPLEYTLDVLDIRQTPIKEFERNALTRLSITTSLHTDNARLCCPQVRGEKIPKHICYAPKDAISSCSDLLSQQAHRVLIWIMGCVALLGNVLVVLFRVIWDRQVLKRSYGIFVTNLSVSDFLMGVYLLVIAGVDLRFKGDYVLHDSHWRYSDFCKVAGFLSIFSSETSMFFICLITIDRFLVIKFPFGRYHFSLKCVFITTILAWIGGLVLAIIPVLPYFNHWTVYSSNGLCLGLPLSSTRFPGWEYSTGVFVVFNFVIFIFIGCGQGLVYRAMTGNRIKMESAALMSSRRVQEITVAKQLSLIVFTDFLCWFPIGVMGLMAMNGQDVGQEAYAWSAVLVLPINSALNPILYTLPAAKAKWERFKRGNFESIQRADRAKNIQQAPNADTAGPPNTTESRVLCSLCKTCQAGWHVCPDCKDRTKITQLLSKADTPGPSGSTESQGLIYVCKNCQGRCYVCPDCGGCPHYCFKNSCPNFEKQID